MKLIGKGAFTKCYEMMKRGACYVANHHSLTITLTGGY
ncbi:hypothetical protein [Salmonella phage ST56]|nr:hypothetical protein [Salmonella phage ST56]WJJ60439.1 hypothetical protein [Salmonella phage ST16]WJJ60591.1 hypothetical protein [Salmonella phage ST10]